MSLLSTITGALPPLPLPVPLPALPDLEGSLAALVDELQVIVDHTALPLAAGSVDLAQDSVDLLQDLLAAPSLAAAGSTASDLLHTATAAAGGAVGLIGSEAVSPLLDIVAGKIAGLDDTLAAALAPISSQLPQLAPVLDSLGNLTDLLADAVAHADETLAPVVDAVLGLVDGAVGIVDAVLTALGPVVSTLDEAVAGLLAGELPGLPALPGDGLPALPGLGEGLALLPALPELPISADLVLGVVATVTAAVDAALGVDGLPDLGGLLGGDLLAGGLPALPGLPDLGGLLGGGGLPDLGALLGGDGLPDLAGLLPALPDLGSLLPPLPDVPGLDVLLGVLETVVDVVNTVVEALPLDALPPLPAPVVDLLLQVDALTDPLLPLGDTSIGVSLDAVAAADLAVVLPLAG